MINRNVLSGLALAGLIQPACAYDLKTRLDLEPLIVKHATANNLPPALVHRIIIRESRYNPRAVGRGGAMGLMQIKHGTARALGYAGSPAGLLDAETNLTYGVRYLAGAYRVANGDQNRTVGYYARGYYYDAKRRGMLGSPARGRAATPAEETVVTTATPQPEQAPSIFSALFAPPAATAQAGADPSAQAAQQASQQTTQTETDEAAPPAKGSRRAAKRKAALAATPTAAPGQAEDAQPSPAQAAGAPAKALTERRARTAEPQGSQAEPLKEARTEAPRKEPRTEGRTGPAPRATAKTSKAGETAETAAASAAVAPGAEGSVKRSGRPAGRPPAAGAGRSGQTASEQPGDPGSRP